MSNRIAQGGNNSAANFQEKVSAYLPSWVKISRPGLTNSSSLQQTKKRYWRFYEISSRYAMRGTLLFLPEVQFLPDGSQVVGLIIDADGVKFNPNNLYGLKDSDTPRTASLPCAYVHDTNWISTSIPRFSELVAALRELLEITYVKAGSNRKKKSISMFEVAELGCNSNIYATYKDIQQQLQKPVQITHRDPNTPSAFIQRVPTRIRPSVLPNGHPLNFQIDNGSIAQTVGIFERHFLKSWNPLDYVREGAYPVVHAFHKLGCLLVCDQIMRIFTDHLKPGHYGTFTGPAKRFLKSSVGPLPKCF